MLVLSIKRGRRRWMRVMQRHKFEREMEADAEWRPPLCAAERIRRTEHEGEIYRWIAFVSRISSAACDLSGCSRWLSVRRGLLK